MDRLPSTQAIMLPILRRAAGGEVDIGELPPMIAVQFALSSFEMRLARDSGARIMRDRLYSSLDHLVRAGLLARVGYGVYAITDEGRALLATNPEEITFKMLKKLKG